MPSPDLTWSQERMKNTAFIFEDCISSSNFCFHRGDKKYGRTNEFERRFPYFPVRGLSFA
jgi:hypothetical protein